MTFIRGRQIPQCYQCGALKVRPSRPVGFWGLGSRRDAIT